MIRNVNVLLFIMVAFVWAQVLPSVPITYNIHVVNGLSNLALVVHYQSKDDDLGIHNLSNRGDEYKWNFKENIGRTTFFWCK